MQISFRVCASVPSAMAKEILEEITNVAETLGWFGSATDLAVTVIMALFCVPRQPAGFAAHDAAMGTTCGAL